MSKARVKFLTKGEKYFRVLADGRIIGEVYYDPDAWPGGRWFYVGQARELEPDPTARGRFAPVTAEKKYRGFRSRQLAAEALLSA